MQQDTTPTETEETTVANPGLPSLYHHSKRQQWGLGLIIRHRGDRADLQFQDGRMRTLHLNYKHLLEPVDRPYDLARGLVEALEAMAPDELRPRASRGPAPISLLSQARYFRELYPEGFGGDRYRSDRRNDGRKRALLRHRDALIGAAKKMLSKEAIAKHRADGGALLVHAAAVKVANRSDLVSAKERRAFAKIDMVHHEGIAVALRALLHGTSPIAQRFDAWVRTLETAMGQTPSWQLATLFLAAFAPEKHFVVQPKTVERQAEFMAPGLRAGTRPMGVLYERLLGMVHSTRERMLDEGLAPRDMMDVREFMWLTLKPKARKWISERAAERVEASTEALEVAAA